MKVISIGTDRKIFLQGSAARDRMSGYGRLFDELHIIVFSLKKHGLKNEKISDNVWIYPTNSLLKIFYIRDSVRIADDIMATKSLDSGSVVVTSQDPFETGISGAKICKKYDLPFQVQVHTDLFSKYFSRSSVLNMVRVFISRRILPKANEIRVVSERIKRSIIEKLSMPESRVDVLPIAADLSIRDRKPAYDLHEKYPQFNFIISMASRLSKEKEIGFAIDVFGEVLKHFPGAGLVIAGDGPEKSRLVKRSHFLGIEKSVVFEQWQNDLAPFYKTSDLFLVTSSFEGYGLTIAEARVCGARVVASDVGVAMEINEKCGGVKVCPVLDRKAFSKAIIDEINSKNSRENSSSSSETCGIILNKQEYENLYKKLVEKANEEFRKSQSKIKS